MNIEDQKADIEREKVNIKDQKADIETEKLDIENLFTKFLHFSEFTCFFLLFMLL